MPAWAGAERRRRAVSGAGHLQEHLLRARTLRLYLTGGSGSGPACALLFAPAILGSKFHFIFDFRSCAKYSLCS